MSVSNLISVDWGTSNLRIAQLNLLTQQLGVVRNGEHGIKATNNAWKESKQSRLNFFLGYLVDEIRKADLPMQNDIPILISGMASSSIGVKELPYATLPFSCQGNGLIVQTIPNSSHAQIHLISGVRSESDVMRGEETQLIGLQRDLPNQGTNLIILPGTHSKHVKIVNGHVTDFQTFLTGELFDVIRKHTILKDSAESGSDISENLSFFRKGVEAAAQGQFLQSLFKIRAMDLLHKQSKGQNYHFLSGLHLGLELASLQGGSADLYLASVEPLSSLYREAADVLDLHLHLIPPAIVQGAVMQGHLQIYNSSILS